jgi:hypothetical protein
MDTKLQLNETLLEPGLSLRPAPWADLQSVTQLILDVCTADGDPTVAVTLEELEREWNSPGFELARNAWRKRGLGEALLLRSFRAFYKHGMNIIGVGVDAENPTVYKKAGMHVAAEYVIYEKELRSGREPEEQEQEKE